MWNFLTGGEVPCPTPHKVRNCLNPLYSIHKEKHCEEKINTSFLTIRQLPEYNFTGVV